MYRQDKILRPVDMVELFDRNEKRQGYVTKKFAKYICSKNPLWQQQEDGTIRPTGTSNGKNIWLADVLKTERKGKYGTTLQKLIKPDGSIPYIRNELDLFFTYDDNSVKIVSGWHIGASESNYEPGDEDCIEHFWPGLLEQLKEQMETF